MTSEETERCEWFRERLADAMLLDLAVPIWADGVLLDIAVPVGGTRRGGYVSCASIRGRRGISSLEASLTSRPNRFAYVDEVNGPNSAEMPEFVPTRYELIQLAKYWVTIALDLRFDYFLYTSTGSSEWRLDAFASRRVGRIVEILGQDEINKVIDQAYEEYGKEQDPRAWSIFLNGTPEEKEAFQDEIQQRISEQIERNVRSPFTAEELSKFDVEMLTEAA